jgi:hypothetical protein
MYALTALYKADSINKSRDQFGHLFDERCVRWLKYIVDKTDCKIVISSTWRRSGLSVMQEMWKFRNLPGEVIDITSNSWNLKLSELYAEPQANRGYEIQEWVNNHPEIESYCIVDDDNDMLKHQIFVQTKGRIGLDYDTSHSIVKILNHEK